MSSYEYSHDGRRFSVDTAADQERVFVTAQHASVPLHGMWIPNTDVPTVAGELLKAAGQESVIVPKLKVGAATAADPGFFRFEGDTGLYPQSADWWTHRIKFAEEQLGDALRYLALGKVAVAWIESTTAREAAEKAEAEAAEKKKLQERRDALSFQLAGDGNAALQVQYANRTVTMRQAINRIIELEDKLDGASRD